MKKFKITLCALLVLCCGLFFAACGGEKTKTFNASKISIEDETAQYDGNSHVFTVKYDGVKNLNITYSLTENGTFVSKDNLGLIDAGEYEVYYKLSAKGYESYISADPVTFTISKKPYDFDFGSSEFQFNVNDDFNIDEVVSYTHNVVGNDDVEPQFKIYKHGEPNTVLDPAEIENLAGQTYEIALQGITGTDAGNYAVVSSSVKVATLKFIDNIMVKKGETETYCKTLAEAVSSAAEQNGTVQLLSDVEIDQTIEINSSVTINGFNKKISLSDQFVPGVGDGKTGRNIFAVKNAAATLTLEDVVIDGEQQVTCVTVIDGKIVLKNGAKIINGKRTVEGLNSDKEIDKLVGGLYLTGKSELVMDGGEITGNSNAVEGEYEREARKYASDLWIGSEAKATISGGTIGNMFINANNSQTEDSLTTVKGSAHIGNAFVELDGSKYAKLVVEADGLIDKIIVKTGTSQDEDTFITYDQAEAGKYNGGIGVVAIKIGEVEYNSLQEAINQVTDQGTIIISHNIQINSQVNIPSNKKFTITSEEGKQCEISASADFEGTAMISAGKNTSGIELTLENIVIDGGLRTSCLYLANTELTIKNGANIGNGKLMVEDAANASAEELQNGGVYMTGKSTFTMEGGLIKYNHNADKNGAEFGSALDEEIYALASDLWLGSEVTANITGGEIGNIWVNANKASNDEPDEEGYGLTVAGSAKIEKVYLEYYYDNDVAYGTILNYGCNMEGIIADCTAIIDKIYVKNYFAKDDEVNNNATSCTIIDNTTENSYNFYESGFVGTMKNPDVSETSGLPDTINLNYIKFTEILENGLEGNVNYEIDLLVDIKLSSTQLIKQNVTLNGNNHTISAIKADGEKFGATTEGTYEGKENRSLFMIPYDDKYENLEVVFKNVALDGKGLARGLSLYKGKTSLEVVTIRNGKAADNSWSGGIFLTSNAQLSIKDSTIKGNVQYDESTESELISKDKYANLIADLWVGANAAANVQSLDVENSTIGNIWVNSNKYSADNPGAFTIKSGEIDNVWVEFDNGFGAVLNVESGKINKLYISQGYSESDYNEPVVIDNAGAGKYVGGANATATKNGVAIYDSFEKLVKDTDINEIKLVANVEVKEVIKIENERNLTIEGTHADDNFEIKANSEFKKEDNLNGTSLATIFYVNEATLTIKNAKLNGNSVARAISSFAADKKNVYINLENVEVTGGKDVDKRHSGGVFLSDETIATLTNCTINNNEAEELDGENKLSYAADLWIGSEVQATISGGSYGSIFVNANEYTNSGTVNLTINNDANITNMFVEFDDSCGATVKLEYGIITNLYIAPMVDSEIIEKTQVQVNSGEEALTITGGQDYEE